MIALIEDAFYTEEEEKEEEEGYLLVEGRQPQCTEEGQQDVCSLGGG